MRLLLGITGASGIVYAETLLQALAGKKNIKTYLIMSQSSKEIMKIEGVSPSQCEQLADKLYSNSNFSAPLASGTFKWDAMVVIPCSMKSLSAIANGLELNLILRAAQVTLKEDRKLILVPRETPLNSLQLGNMLKLSKNDVIILPPCPGFYHNPETISDLIDFIVGKVLNLLNLEQDLISEWGSEE